MTTQQIQDILTAFAEGKTIEFRKEFGVGSNQWNEVNPRDTYWNFEDFYYRVKPEPPKPREFWLMSKQKRPIYSASYEVRFCDAGPPPSDAAEFAEIIHVQEVIE